MKSFKEFQESVAQEVGGKGLITTGIRTAANVAAGPIKKAAKVANVFRSSKGKDILQGLLGTPDKPKDTDWEKNPKDIIDAQLNADQRRVKQRAKYKTYDDAMKAAKKAKDAGNITDDDYVKKVKEAGKLRGKGKNGGNIAPPGVTGK